MSARIEDYAMIGDCESAALVSRGGSIDWLCWPRFDSDACFAALLGTRDNGRWLIAPTDPAARVTRRYRGDTLILETRFETAEGAATLIDFMPLRDAHCNLVRVVIGERGVVPMRTELVIRFGYGAIVPWVTRLDDGSLRAIAGPDMLVLHAPVDLHGEALTTVGEFAVTAGQCLPFVLTYCALTPAASGGTRSGGCARGNGILLARVGGAVRRRRAVARRDRALAPHPQGAHLCADRRHHRGADHLAAGAARAARATGTIAIAGCAMPR